MTKVKSLDHLKEMLAGTEGNPLDFCISNGLVRSSKSLMLDNGKVNIFNEIDETTQLLTFDELNDKNVTNIGIAIGMGYFYKY